MPPSLLAAVDRALQLRLVHARAALDVELPRLVVELLLRAALRAVRAGAHAAAAAGGHVLAGEAGRRLRLAGTRPLLVDGARGDLLRALRRRALLLLAVDDVLVLPFSLGAPRRGHRFLLGRVTERKVPRASGRETRASSGRGARSRTCRRAG